MRNEEVGEVIGVESSTVVLGGIIMKSEASVVAVVDVSQLNFLAS